MCSNLIQNFVYLSLIETEILNKKWKRTTAVRMTSRDCDSPWIQPRGANIEPRGANIEFKNQNESTFKIDRGQKKRKNIYKQCGN